MSAKGTKVARVAVKPAPAKKAETVAVNVNLDPCAAIDGMRGRGIKVVLTDRGKWTVTDADAKAIAWAKAQTTTVHDLGATSFRIDLGLAQPEKAAPTASKPEKAKSSK